MTTTRPRHAKTNQEVLQQDLPERRYLPELHGVRGLALAGVVLFHLFGSGRVSGGIDIFLAVSGFLFTGMLLREAATRNGRIDPLKYYGRLVRRILIPAAVVVAATLAIGLLVSPVTKHSQLWAEARASLLYFENFELINSQLAYGAAGPETSPFQHFWSLSVQGQFYIIWPAIAIIAVMIARRLRTSAAAVMAILISIVFIASFIYAIYVGSYNQDEAYLMTTTRAWQLAFGGFLALAGGTLRLPRPLRAPAGWIGLGLIVSTGFVLDGAQLFPGPWALYPLAGLTLILISAGPQGGRRDPKHTATRFLSNTPLAWIGDHAYGLYLWHWPLLIYYLEIRGRDAIGWRGALVVLAVTVALAMLTYRYVEVPFKNRQQNRPQYIAHRANKVVVAVAAITLAVAGTGATMVLNEPRNQVASVFEEWDWEAYPGAMTTTGSYDAPENTDFLPRPENLSDDRSEFYGTGCFQPPGNEPGTDKILVCDDPESPDDPTATVVIAGGSHSVHWQEAYKALAAEYGWELLVVNKSGCVFHTNTGSESLCGAWNDNFIEWLQHHEVDLVVTSGTRIGRQSDEKVEEGAPQRWKQITDAGPELVLMRGTPRPLDDVPDCLAEGNSPVECGPLATHISDTDPLASQNLPAGAHHIDMNEYVCPPEMVGDSDHCPSVVGNVAVYFDNSHLSNTFVATMTPLIEAELRGSVEWLFE